MSVAEITETRVFNANQIVPQRLTWEEYLRFGEENTLAEWVDGRVIVLFSGSTKHQQIVGFLDRVIGFYIETHNLGQVFTAPYAMKLSKLRRGREPDLLFVSREREHLITKTFLDGAADLVVEVVSPESVERDSVQKFAEYEAAGIREYWLIDYTSQTAIFYQLDEKGQYQPAETTDGVFHSTVLPGFFIRENWLWQERLHTFEALRELGIL
ncbi:MAG TPA: Uma2 family endonuclease [Pyrinomonadaceae bacterium]|jgi:Uma2 family endonuclease